MAVILAIAGGYTINIAIIIYTVIYIIIQSITDYIECIFLARADSY